MGNEHFANSKPKVYLGSSKEKFVQNSKDADDSLQSAEGIQAAAGAPLELMGQIAEMNVIMSRLENFSVKMEQSKIAEYMNYLENPSRLIRMNLLMGMARGFGFAVGLGILSALAIYILQIVIKMNLPLISNFLIDILTQADQYINLYNR